MVLIVLDKNLKKNYFITVKLINLSNVIIKIISMDSDNTYNKGKIWIFRI